MSKSFNINFKGFNIGEHNINVKGIYDSWLVFIDKKGRYGLANLNLIDSVYEKGTLSRDGIPLDSLCKLTSESITHFTNKICNIQLTGFSPGIHKAFVKNIDDQNVEIKKGERSEIIKIQEIIKRTITKRKESLGVSTQEQSDHRP